MNRKMLKENMAKLLDQIEAADGSHEKNTDIINQAGSILMSLCGTLSAIDMGRKDYRIEAMEKKLDSIGWDLHDYTY